MRQTRCPHETAVTAAVRTGRVEGVRDHVAGCAVCREVASAAIAMQSLTADPAAELDLPDASWIWRKALLEKKQTEMERVHRPVRVIECGSVSAVVGLVAWMVWQFAQVPADLWVQFVGWPHGLWARLDRPDALILLLAISLVLAARPFLAEE